MSKAYTTGEVADICHVSARTVCKWFDTGRLKGFRMPGSQDRRIPEDDLEEFLERHGVSEYLVPSQPPVRRAAAGYCCVGGVIHVFTDPGEFRAFCQENYSNAATMGWIDKVVLHGDAP